MKLLLLPILCAVSLAQPSPPNGPGEPPPKFTTVVTGAFEPVPLDETVRSVRVIDVRESRNLFDSISAFLQTDASVDLRRRAPGDTQGDLSIRGGTFAQSLVLLNGIRINDSQSSHHNMDLPVPLDAISEIQILHGSGSTQYGSDAVTGVVNLLVRPPPEPEVRLRAGLGNYGINQESGVLAFGARTLSESLVFSRDFSSGFLPDRDYRDLALTSLTHATTRWGSTDVLLAASDRPFGADQFYGNFNSWERTKGWFASLRQQLGAHTEIDLSFRRHTDLFVLYRDRPDVFTNRHALETWDGAIRRSGRISYGVEMYADRIASSNLGDHSRLRGAGYAAYDARLRKRFSFSAGLRDEVYGSLHHQLSPTVSAGAWLSSQWKLRVAVSRAFRLPTYTDLYYHDPANVGSPNLRPETAWNYEAGVDWRLNSKLKASATVFHRRDTDLIDYVQYSPNDIFRATNFQKLQFTGFEGTVEWRRFSAQYSALSGQRAAVYGAISKYVFNYPIHNGIVAWQGKLPGGLIARTRLGVTERYARDPYAIWDVSAARARGRIRPFVQLSNLTSTVYQEVAGIVMPKRTIIGGMEYRFIL